MIEIKEDGDKFQITVNGYLTATLKAGTANAFVIAQTAYAESKRSMEQGQSYLAGVVAGLTYMQLLGLPKEASDALAIVAAINELREEEGMVVEILYQSPDEENPERFEAIDVTDTLGGWCWGQGDNQPPSDRFLGPTLRAALEKAVEAKRKRW